MLGTFLRNLRLEIFQNIRGTSGVESQLNIQSPLQKWNFGKSVQKIADKVIIVVSWSGPIMLDIFRFFSNCTKSCKITNTLNYTRVIVVWLYKMHYRYIWTWCHYQKDLSATMMLKKIKTKRKEAFFYTRDETNFSINWYWKFSLFCNCLKASINKI